MREHDRAGARTRRGLLARLADLIGIGPAPGTGTGGLRRRRHDGDVSFGRSPTLREIEALAHASGFRSLLNLNTEGESGEPMSPNVEASWAHAFAMQHERVSIDLAHLRSAWVDRFLTTLQGIAKPVYVHSRNGRRATVLMAIHAALERGLTGNQALSAARALGLDGAADELAAFVVVEVDQRRRAAAALGSSA